MLVPTLGNDISTAERPAPQPMGVGAAGRAAQTRAPVLIADFNQSVGTAAAAGRVGGRAAMGVPLFYEGQLIGALAVGVDQQRLRPGSDQLAALQELADGWSKNDQLALLSAIYTLFRRRAIGLAWRLLGDRELAQEAVQDVFLAVWRSGAHYDPAKGSLRAWVLTMVHRRAIDVHRMGVRRPVQSIDDHAFEVQADEDPALEAQRRVDGVPVRGALWDLSPEQREVIELAYFGGLTHREIAAAVHAPLGTIKGRIRLALHQLRRSQLICSLAQASD